MQQSSLSRFLTGSASPRLYFRNLIANLSFCFLFILIAVALYRPTYSFTAAEISWLDNPLHNPVGLWFFKIAFIVGGLWFLPSALSLRRMAAATSSWLGNLAGIFYILSGIGLVLVAFSPTRVSQVMHVVGAGLGFGGILLGITFTILVLLLKLHRQFDRKVASIMLVFHVPFLVVYLLTILFAGIPLVVSLTQHVAWGDFIPDGWFVFEWLMFVTALYSTLGTYAIFAYYSATTENE